MAALIRPATSDDVPRIVAMAERFYPESGFLAIAPLDPSQVEGLVIITMETGTMLVAEKGGEVIGMACLHVDHFVFNLSAKIATEIAFWIEPEHRGGALAVRMLSAIEVACRAAGAHWVRMAALPSSPPQAAALYARMGYAPDGIYFMKAL